MAQAQMKRETDKMLGVYIHDYLVKNNLHNSAKAFMIQGKVSPDPVAIDAPGSFLYESWSSFWDIFMSSTNDKHFESTSAYIEAQQTNAREQQLEMQQLQHDSAELQRRHPHHSALDGYINGMNSEGMMGLPPTSVLAMKMDEEQMKHFHSMDSEVSPTLIHANRIALPKSATRHQGQLVDGNSANMPTALQQIQARSSLTTMKMAQAQHSLSKQKEQLQQNNRKRKQHSSFGAHSTGTRNTMGPSPNSLDTTSNMQRVNNVQKSTMMYSTERTGGLVQSSILMDDVKQFGDVGILDDDVESFLLYLQEDGDNLYGTVKQSQPVEQQKETSKGFTFAECGCIKTRNNKVTSCNFSSDGKSLASAGHDNKA